MRELILSIASKLFMELGYEPVSMTMIAKRAEVTKASVYYYFPNKAELFTNSITDMMGRICFFTSKILEAHQDLRTRLEQIALRKMTRSHMEFESMMREAEPFLTDEQREKIRRAENAIHELMAETFQEAMDNGSIPSGNALLLSHAFSALLMIGNREWAGGVRYSIEELSKLIVDLLWTGIATRV